MEWARCPVNSSIVNTYACLSKFTATRLPVAMDDVMRPIG